METANVQPANEADLIQRAQQRDKHAFERLYRHHVGRVYALCLRLTGNSTLAQEVTQDVFVHLWNIIGSYRGESAFSTWLHRVTVNIVLIAKRSQKRRFMRIFATDDLEEFDVADAPQHPGNKMDMEQAIASLPPQARKVLVLHDVEGYRHEEIATMMNVAIGTSKAQLHRARKLLRGALER